MCINVNIAEEELFQIVFIIIIVRLSKAANSIQTQERKMFLNHFSKRAMKNDKSFEAMTKPVKVTADFLSFQLSAIVLTIKKFSPQSCCLFQTA